MSGWWSTSLKVLGGCWEKFEGSLFDGLLVDGPLVGVSLASPKLKFFRYGKEGHVSFFNSFCAAFP